MSQTGSNLPLSQLHPLRPRHTEQSQLWCLNVLRRTLIAACWHSHSALQNGLCKKQETTTYYTGSLQHIIFLLKYKLVRVQFLPHINLHYQEYLQKAYIILQTQFILAFDLCTTQVQFLACLVQSKAAITSGNRIMPITMFSSLDL